MHLFNKLNLNNLLWKIQSNKMPSAGRRMDWGSCVWLLTLQCRYSVASLCSRHCSEHTGCLLSPWGAALIPQKGERDQHTSKLLGLQQNLHKTHMPAELQHHLSRSEGLKSYISISLTQMHQICIKLSTWSFTVRLNGLNFLPLFKQ